jgi:hypothetical protein
VSCPVAGVAGELGAVSESGLLCVRFLARLTVFGGLRQRASFPAEPVTLWTAILVLPLVLHKIVT